MEILKIDKVNKFYGELHALKDVSLSVAQGEVVVILGPSGCGKSTLLRTINGLEPVQSGNFIIEGERIDQNFKEWRRIRQKIGMVFQSYELFDHLSVLHNIILGPMKVQNVPKEEAIALAREWLKIVGLADKENSYPKELSGGQKQRIAIVRSLVMKPKIMLFDEVTAALDPEIVREVLDVMLNLAKEGQTMLIVTHEMGFARAVADRIVFMDEGSIVEINKPEAFFTAPKSERAKKFLNMFEFKK
ncbi:amino acid ABC transporter ATP-binding protein [uncultured Campylobacter sp.]|mgnify:FL=1|uniref:amino acid ABC transporter ATP-binding protein n=1 Tax=uncultured Campylobacter sp. TaxID=218934 RepID=UPI0026307081|nr:amino acid ABC transporter ATP-binding protein [uncultured Campylobacter sp.]